MPVEIKELVVRAVVRSPGPQEPQTDRSSAAVPAGLGDDERQALVAASVREVLRILERSKER